MDFGRNYGKLEMRGENGGSIKRNRWWRPGKDSEMGMISASHRQTDSMAFFKDVRSGEEVKRERGNFPWHERAGVPS